MPRPPLRALLIDLSGTLHIDKEPTPSAVQALHRLREAKIPLRFCSNTSKESTPDLRDKLNKIGFNVKDEEIWTSLGALGDLVKAKILKNPYFFLSRSAMKEFPEHAYLGDIASSHTDYDSVVIGLAPELFTYDRLTTAFRILISNSSAQFITTHRAKYVRTPDGELSLGPGPFVTALEDAVGGGRHAEVVGKPSRAFYERVLMSFSKESSRDEESMKWDNVAIIGDDVVADLGEGAVELKLWRVLVRTGKYRPGDEERKGISLPDEVYDSFASFVDSLLQE